MTRLETGNLHRRLMRIKSHTTMFSLTYRGRPVQEQSVFSDAVITWLVTMSEFLPEGLSTSWVIQTYYRLHTCDVFLLGNWFKKLSLAVRRLPDQASIPIALFKGEHLGGTLYSGQLTLPLTKYVDFSSVSNRQLWLTYLDFLSRVNLILPCEDYQVNDYLANEQRLKDHTFRPVNLARMNTIMREWFQQPLNIDSPRHGPGAVASLLGRPSKGVKYAFYEVDQLLEYGMRNSNAWDLLEPLADEKLDRVSELLFVPKSLTSYRTICKEPVALQLWQQATCFGIVEAMDKSLRHQVNLSDQNLSKRFAKLASVNTDYVTIDLSAASDSVSVRLVKEIFKGTPLIKPLLATRSRAVRLPDGSLIEMEKFAPMGSAVCFPVQCIIFSAICEIGTRLSNRKRRDYRVYGDDIICHRSILPNVLALLTDLGFVVNQTKSFTDRRCSFRESCGGEYYQGTEVTPMRLSRWFSGLSKGAILANPDRYISLCNTLFSNGCHGIREYIISVLLTLKHAPIFSYGTVGLWSNYPTNFHLKKRTVGCDVYYSHGVTSTKVEKLGRSFEVVRYVDWWLSISRRKDELNMPEGMHHIGGSRTVWKKSQSPAWLVV